MSKVRITVMVDDYVSERGIRRGALPSHGFGLLVEGKTEDGTRYRLLIDGGPLWEILLHNAAALGAEVTNLDAAVATLWSAHHVTALLHLAREGGVSRLYLPPRPKHRATRWEELVEAGAILLPLESPIYNERVVVLRLSDGYAAIVSCSVYGVDSVLRPLKRFEEETGSAVRALVGGFNLSTFNLHDIRLLRKFASARNALLVPLHSTSIEARERLSGLTGLDEIPGVGSRITL